MEVVNKAEVIQLRSKKKDEEISALFDKIEKLQKLLKQSQMYKYVEDSVTSSTPKAASQSNEVKERQLEKYELINESPKRG
jgi:hypothetical protein